MYLVEKSLQEKRIQVRVTEYLLSYSSFSDMF